jgi:hypothetical protein
MVFYTWKAPAEKKAELRRECASSFDDKVYHMTTMQQCNDANLWKEALTKCKAWVSGNTDYCIGLAPTDTSWCNAMATKDPAKCEGTGSAANYCKAFVTRNPALCDGLVGTDYEYSCAVTIKGDYKAVDADAAELCGEDTV